LSPFAREAREIARKVIADILSDLQWHTKHELVLAVRYAMDDHLLVREYIHSSNSKRKFRNIPTSKKIVLSIEEQAWRSAIHMVARKTYTLCQNGYQKNDCGTAWSKIKKNPRGAGIANAGNLL
jgi:hypothetical protein